MVAVLRLKLLSTALPNYKSITRKQVRHREVRGLDQAYLSGTNKPSKHKLTVCLTLLVTEAMNVLVDVRVGTEV